MSDPLSCLNDTLAAIQNGEPLPPAARAWLQSGLSRYVTTGEALETALSLTVAGRMLARNRALIEAARHLDPDGDLSPWDLAERLRLAIRRFEQQVLPRLTAGADRELSPHEAAILRACDTGVRMVRSRRRLWDLLTNQEPACQKNDVTLNSKQPHKRERGNTDDHQPPRNHRRTA